MRPLPMILLWKKVKKIRCWAVPKLPSPGKDLKPGFELLTALELRAQVLNPAKKLRSNQRRSNTHPRQGSFPPFVPSGSMTATVHSRKAGQFASMPAAHKTKWRTAFSSRT
jgi:hypothetical protein